MFYLVATSGLQGLHTVGNSPVESVERPSWDLELESSPQTELLVVGPCPTNSTQQSVVIRCEMN